VLRGRYAYVLERAGPLDGSLNVYDIQDVNAPLALPPIPVAQVSVQGFPRDLVLIPGTPTGSTILLL